MTPKRFVSKMDAHRWLGMQGTPPWLISEDGTAITTFLSNTATISYTEANGDKHVLMMPISAFMSMLDDGIHLFEDYHYSPDTWMQPQDWKTEKEA